MSFGSLSLKGKALQYLSQREHSRAELQAKLLRHVAQALRRAAASASTSAAATPSEDDGASLARARAEIDQLLDELAAGGLQSDSRTAESLARSKNSRYGEHRLRQHLQAKGLDPQLVAQTLGLNKATEFQRAQDLWRRRFGEPALDIAERARQARFLTARGFDSDIVRKVVRGADDRD